MGFKKQKWSSYSYKRKGHKLKIEVFDETKRKMESLFSDNEGAHKRNSSILNEKYGINLTPSIPREMSINEEEMKFLDKERNK